MGEDFLLDSEIASQLLYLQTQDLYKICLFQIPAWMQPSMDAEGLAHGTPTLATELLTTDHPRSS